jgi:nitrogenase subunit NifH
MSGLLKESSHFEFSFFVFSVDGDIICGGA